MMYAGGLYLIATAFLLNSIFYIWRLKKKQSLILGCVLFSLGIVVFYLALVISQHIFQIPFLFGSYALICSFLNVFYILLINYYFDQNFNWKRIYWLLYIFPLLQFVFYFPYLILPEEFQLEIIQRTLEKSNYYYFPSSISFYMHVFMLGGLYLFAITFIGKKFRWDSVQEKYKTKVRVTLTIVYSWIVISFVIDFLSISRYISQSNSPELKILIEFSIVYLFFQFFQWWPYYFKEGFVFFDLKTFKIDKYFNNYLVNVSIDQIKKSLKHTMQVEKFYKRDDISAASLSKHLGITVHQLSAYLNQHLNQNFSELINSRRIEEAKVLFKTNKAESILQVCYEVGFNSPSVFYKAFKAETGLSPKEWQKINL